MIHLLSMILCLFASQAAALSCIQPDVARSYQQIAASETSYVVLLGQFDFDETALPRHDFSDQTAVQPDNLIPGQFTGKYLRKDGFSGAWSGDVTINAQCFGPWCSGMTAGVETLAFVEKQADGYVLAVSPCGGFAFPDPTTKLITTVEACHAGKSCSPADF